MRNYQESIDKIKASFTKEQLKTFQSIKALEKLELASLGSHDEEGYQIFTPEFIVRDMSAAVGDDILDPNKTVLEPTSGDGAFTTYILQKRLEASLESDDFESRSLQSLSTIYSIEMDKTLIERQRNNILTVIVNFAKDHNLTLDPTYYELAKCIITTNFMWAMFNSDIDITPIDCEVAYAMPKASKGKLQPLEMPVWEIKDGTASLHYEEAEINE